MALTLYTGTVERLEVKLETARVRIRARRKVGNIETYSQRWYWLWGGEDVSAFDRITFSMWVSMLEQALSSQKEVRLLVEEAKKRVSSVELTTSPKRGLKPPRSGALTRDDVALIIEALEPWG